MTTGHLSELRARLLDWFDRHRRDLPWRVGDGETADPYHVWLSETMLQQTRVETVRPYFERWLRQYPTLESLAEAPLEKVLKAWEGLGYYSRARNLHRAVREVSERYGGKVPADPAAFRSLPGVGRYTAGAVMSIAFDQEEPVVDGNVRRVLARWLDAAAPADAELWEIASALVVGERPGTLNQAMMELGAVVCTPRSPRCGVCPVAQLCAAREAGTQLERPAPRRRGPLPRENRVAAVLQRNGRVLVARRREGERLGGLWEFPGGLMHAGESASQAAERVLPEVVGLHVRSETPLAVVEHTFTHVRVTYHAVRVTTTSEGATPFAYDEVRWLAPAALQSVALPRAQQRIAAFAFPPEPLAQTSAQG